MTGSSNLFFRVEATEILTEPQSEEEACSCKNPGPQYVLEIDCGSIYLRHTDCGKPILDPSGDLLERICLEPVSVQGEWSKCTCMRTHPNFSGCDCDRYLELEADNTGGKR
jgi:hypothetical protein